MGLFSEVYTEGTIKLIVQDIRKALEVECDPLIQKGLKRAGRIALTHFEWDTPVWSKEFEELFKE
jgi:hypothetical protein